MSTGHRLPIVAAAVAALGLTGGLAAASTNTDPSAGDPIPDTDLGRAVEGCIDSVEDFQYDDAYFYDEGHSVAVGISGVNVSSTNEEADCVLEALDLPQWVSHVATTEVLKFGDWSVFPASTSLWILIMDDEVAPDN